MDTVMRQSLVQPAQANVRQIDSDVSILFQDALRDRSNLELDWLWLATQVTRAGEQSYCFQQALRINPRSALARRGLGQLAQRPGAPIDFTAWAQHVFACH